VPRPREAVFIDANILIKIARYREATRVRRHRFEVQARTARSKASEGGALRLLDTK
jgi:hypothetical protein